MALCLFINRIWKLHSLYIFLSCIVSLSIKPFTQPVIWVEKHSTLKHCLECQRQEQQSFARFSVSNSEINLVTSEKLYWGSLQALIGSQYSINVTVQKIKFCIRESIIPPTCVTPVRFVQPCQKKSGVGFLFACLFHRALKFIYKYWKKHSSNNLLQQRFGKWEVCFGVPSVGQVQLWAG